MAFFASCFFHNNGRGEVALRAKAVASGFVIIPGDINQVVRDVGPLLFVSISGDSQSPRLKLRI